MSKKIKKYAEYSIGLDIGTNSVGWSVVNAKYKIMNIKGKDAWGAYLFEQAEKSESTRLLRSKRRSYFRRRERILDLQELMSNMVLAEDDSFFIRLKQSFLMNKVVDLELGRDNHYNLFEGKYTDKDYYKQFKTIYHLRNTLANSTEKADIRLVYLALHHIIKYRGNFLHEGKKLDLSVNNLNDILNEFFDLVNDMQDDFLNFDESDEKQVDFINYADKINDIGIILTNKSTTATVKKSKVIDLFKNEKNYKNFLVSFVSALTGKKFKLNDLLLSEEKILDENNEAVSFSFSDEDYEEKEDEYLNLAGDSNEILLKLKSIYMTLLLGDILNGADSISLAMINKYEQHRKDLEMLKQIIKRNLSEETVERALPKEEYYNIFIKENCSNYANYVKKVIKRSADYMKKMELINIKDSQAEENTEETDKKKNEKKDKGKLNNKTFFDKLKKVLESLPQDDDVNECLHKIELENFLPKLNDVKNGAIPYQMNEEELIKIIDNQSKYYPKLAESKEEILSILSYKRPYYMGTLKGKFSWIGQEIEGKIKARNIDDKIKELLSENFITKMTNNCTIFKEEEVLPLKSILYQSYIVLNELNTIKLKKVALSKEMKQNIFLNVMCKNKKVRKIDLIKYLKKELDYNCAVDEISGLAEDCFNGKMSTLCDFKSILKEDFNIKNLDKYEDTIRTLTLFNDSKIIIKRLTEIGIYTADQIKSLSKLKYSNWGRLSRKLIYGILVKGKTILDVMYEDNQHFEAIVSKEEFGFKQILPNNKDTIESFNYERDIKTLYCSPSVKKSIWNALCVIEEVAKTTNRMPDRIFIESTASEEEKKKTVSRRDKLCLLYKYLEEDNNKKSTKNKKSSKNKIDSEIDKEIAKYKNEDCIDKLNSYKNADRQIDTDKLYLWFLQLGRCMYSYEPITYDQINACEIDHIVPRCYIKDDSFENRVLVKRLENQNKGSTLALSYEVQSRMKEFWDFLYKKKFIGNKKFKNLNRGEYKENDCETFVNKQLVETSQIIKEVKNLLLKRYPKATIQCIKAGMISLFRSRYSRDNKPGFYKIRSLNNFHHAKDAYLTAVLGQFTTVACPSWGHQKLNEVLKYYMQNIEKSKDNFRELVNKRYGIVLDLMEKGSLDNFTIDENGEYLWNDIMYSNIFSSMEKNNCLIVKKKEFMANNEFYNQTIYGKNSSKKDLIPLRFINGKPLNPKLYGGYSNENAGYFVVVKYTTEKDEINENEKNEKKEIFKKIPVQVCYLEKTNKDAVVNYLEKELKTIDKIKTNSDLQQDKSVTILTIDKIYKNQLIKHKGQYCYITSETELDNAQELYVKPKYEKLLYLIEKEIISINENNKKAVKKKNKEEKDNNEKNSSENKEENKLYKVSKSLQDLITGNEDLIKEYLSELKLIIEKKYPIYANVAKNIDDILTKYYDKMLLVDKVVYIANLMKATNTGAGRFDVDKRFGGKSNLGRISGQKIIPSETQWIDKSCTGIYVKINNEKSSEENVDKKNKENEAKEIAKKEKNANKEKRKESEGTEQAINIKEVNVTEKSKTETVDK